MKQITIQLTDDSVVHINELKERLNTDTKGLMIKAFALLDMATTSTIDVESVMEEIKILRK